MPKKIEATKTAIIKTFKCSDNSIRAKSFPVSSVFQPATISVSALGVEKGLSSRTPKYDIIMIPNKTRKRIIYPKSFIDEKIVIWAKKLALIVEISRDFV